LNWAINLASRNNNGRRRTSRRNQDRNRTDRTPTPHPDRTFVQTGRNTSSSSEAPVIPSPIVGFVPNRETLRINQANASEPTYPSINSRSPRRTSAPEGTRRTDDVRSPIPFRLSLAPQPPTLPVVEQSSDEIQIRTVPTSERYAFYPEYTYLSYTLPTCNSEELVLFFEHCQNVLATTPVASFNHSLTQLRQITTHPLNFANLLWHVQITISHTGIVERYSWIRRRTRRHHPDVARLEPAYDIHYIWSSKNWTVVPAPANAE
jgi:hypothetical protein